MSKLDDRGLEYVAKYFKALAEPMRLKVLNELREGEKNVGQLKELAGSTQANVSKHLSLLSDYGLVKRESRGCLLYTSLFLLAVAVHVLMDDCFWRAPASFANRH